MQTNDVNKKRLISTEYGKYDPSADGLSNVPIKNMFADDDLPAEPEMSDK